MDEPPSGTYFHAVLDEEARALILMYLHEIQAIFKSHIAYFVDVVPKRPVARPW